MSDLLNKAIEATVNAGKAIMEIYRSGDFGVEIKGDNSPLTLADKAAHNIIVEALTSTQIPILSEEGKHDSYESRKDWDKLWVVDPIDGTKEFIKKTGEFTVNIALVENNYPVLGVVFVPAKGELYYGSLEEGAFKVILSGNWENENCSSFLNQEKVKLPSRANNVSLQVMASVSHLSKETEEFVDLLKNEYGSIDFLSVGSSLKICKVAEGVADIYPRLGPTMEWDTAAGQAVAEAAGARFINWKSELRFDYNRANLLNDWFVVYGPKIKDETLKVLIDQFKLG
ncbi:3'(2'),5'-bisphosphate nucleotidase CysQ [Saccharicrinis aurantiacus]|uniref:3'(2'),5'-bisphosphate nucleotidase CysQ n=1 Tax=Saccharicrinis aurantiacus TaxID=1849719 RepID=UPI00249123B4|nr:3'(2'),5'-bisphosphate nucleotidase CysQ [Saccharicrinis aurantiacus]